MALVCSNHSFIRSQPQFDNGVYVLSTHVDKCKRYLAQLNDGGEEPKSVPYEEQLANLQLISDLKIKLEQEVSVRDGQIEKLKAQIISLSRDKQGLQSDLASAKVRSQVSFYEYLG